MTKLSVLSGFVQKDMLLLHAAGPVKRNLTKVGSVFLYEAISAEWEMVPGKQLREQASTC